MYEIFAGVMVIRISHIKHRVPILRLAMHSSLEHALIVDMITLLSTHVLPLPRFRPTSDAWAGHSHRPRHWKAISTMTSTRPLLKNSGGPTASTTIIAHSPRNPTRAANTGFNCVSTYHPRSPGQEIAGHDWH